MQWARWFDRSLGDDTARALYSCLVEQARQPAFFTDCGVPDTVDGRFEMITLHLFLLLRRLKSGRDGTSDEIQTLAQAIFDTMFVDMDENLREMGVGDLSVGRKVQQMVEAVYGRIAAYERGLEGDDEALTGALRRNLYGTTEVAADQLAAMAAYLRGAVDGLAAQQTDDLLAGRVRFESAPSQAGI